MVQAGDLPPEVVADTCADAILANLTGDDRSRLLGALERAGGNRTEAAALLGISRATLYRRLAQYNASVSYARVGASSETISPVNETIRCLIFSPQRFREPGKPRKWRLPAVSFRMARDSLCPRNPKETTIESSPPIAHAKSFRPPAAAARNGAP